MEMYSKLYAFLHFKLYNRDVELATFQVLLNCSSNHPSLSDMLAEDYGKWRPTPCGGLPIHHPVGLSQVLPMLVSHSFCIMNRLALVQKLLKSNCTGKESAHKDKNIKVLKKMGKITTLSPNSTQANKMSINQHP